MGRRRFGLKLNCVRIARVLSAPSFASKSSSASIKYGDTTEFPSSMSQEDSSCDDNENGSNNKIMVVVNSSFEAKCALDWALSHAVQSQDTVVLLHALKPSSQGTEGGEKRKLKSHQIVDVMKNMCQMKRPGVKVKVVKAAEGEEQGRTIVEEAKKQRVTLLVIGQRKRSLWWGFVRRLWGSNKRGSTANCNAVADYCIQNASCMTIAVRNKNKKLGGYLITTKRHKSFGSWLNHQYNSRTSCYFTFSDLSAKYYSFLYYWQGKATTNVMLCLYACALVCRTMNQNPKNYCHSS